MRAKHPDNFSNINERYEDILDSVGDAFIVIDRECRILYVNKETCRLLGGDASELAGKKISDLIPEAGNWMFHSHLAKAISGDVQVKLDNFKFINKRFISYFYPNKNGITILLHDITVQWHTDELYRLALFLLDRLNESVYLVRFDGRLFHVNEEVSRLLGYSRDELIHMKVFDIEPGITADGWESYFKRIKEGGHLDFESGLMARDGRIIPIDVCVNYVKLFGNEYYCVAARDITERKKLEEALVDAEDFNRSVLDSLTSNIAVLDESGAIVYVNSPWTKFACANGASSDEAVGVGINYIEVCRSSCGPHAEEAPEAVSGILSVIRGEAETFELEYPCHSPEVKRWFQMRVTPFVGRKIRGVVVYHNDITRRKMSEEALRESEANLKRAELISRIGSWQLDIRTYEARWSDASYVLLGYPVGGCTPGWESWSARIHPDDRKMAVQKLKDAISHDEIYVNDYRVVLPDGSIRYMHDVAEHLIKDDKGDPAMMFGTIQDITERKQLEITLNDTKTQAELYLDLISHDINNLNQVALGYLELANDLIRSGGKLEENDRELIEKPMVSLNNSSKLIDKVIKLRKLQTKELILDHVDVCKVLARISDRYSHLSGRDVTIKYTPPAECLILANELIDEIFVNLIENSIKHSHKDMPLVINVLQSTVCEDGKEYFRISIEDNGPGISDEVKEKLFARYSRGETNAKGKGLGLYLIRALVETFHGKVWVEDRVPGDHTKGAKFVVMLPASIQ